MLKANGNLLVKRDNIYIKYQDVFIGILTNKKIILVFVFIVIN